MTPIKYKSNNLYVEGLSIEKLADDNQTPFYCYSEKYIEDQYQALKSAFDMEAKIFYSMKANSNLSILKLLLNKGSGIDVVSGGEIERALNAGATGKDIIYAGVGKTDEELTYAIKTKIHCINVESQSELTRINDICEKLNTKQNISLRVNPDVDAKTHVKITTGKAENKFGIEFDYIKSMYAIASELPNVNIIGISVHIGSQITNLKPFKKAFQIIYDLINDLRGLGHKIKHVDLGGGLGVTYSDDDNVPTFKEYASLIQSIFGNLNIEVYIEPGRLLVANSGLLVTRVVDIKTTSQKTFVIVDAAMNDFIRPTLYNSYHEILPVKNNLGTSNKLYDIVGPICETGDFLGIDFNLQETKKNEVLVIMTCGAYGSVMRSNYNSRPSAAEVFILNNEEILLRKREEIDQLLKLDIIPNL